MAHSEGSTGPAVRGQLPNDIVALQPIVEVFEALGVPYHVGGSLASAVFGVPRSTLDIDVVADLRPQQIRAFLERVSAAYYVSPDAVREAVASGRSFNLIHENGMKLDVFVPHSGPYEREEQKRARLETLHPADDARPFLVKSPEDIVLRKLVWYQAGNQTSEHQLSDVQGVLKIQSDELDFEYLRFWAASLGVDSLLERAIVEARA